jgi:tetratricopeptide (TPR) repeat protein
MIDGILATVTMTAHRLLALPQEQSFMPKRRPLLAKTWLPALALALLSPVLPADAQAAKEPPEISNSQMDAALFHQLLVAEMELRAGQPGVAYQLLLDAARRTGDEGVFRRVVNIAMQARAGDQALVAAKAWSEAVPESIEAHQTVLQIVALLNRPSEAAAPLTSLLKLADEPQRAGVLASLPRLFQRAPEQTKVLAALRPVLESARQQEATRMMASLVLGRFALNAGENDLAVALTRELAQAYPQADEPLMLALDVMPVRSEVEELITSRLQARPDHHTLRLAYARTLARSQRAGDAAREFRTVTENAPELDQAWFALGALELELRHNAAAEKALNTFLQRIGDDEQHKDLRQQAWLMLAQSAEQRGELKTAEALLAKVDLPQRQTEVTARRASLLARQGQVSKARQLIQSLPGDRAEDKRVRDLAEVQLLREVRDWRSAYQLLEQLTQQSPDDVDLLYEQAMIAEKLERMDEMEKLLRRVMELKPEHYHAYNALGYSLAERSLRLSEAKTLIAKALEYAPNEPFIVDSLGWVEYRLGNHAEALRLLRQAYKARPDAEIAAHLGEVLWVSGEREEARRVWAEGRTRDPKNEALQETSRRLQGKR